MLNSSAFSHSHHRSICPLYPASAPRLLTRLTPFKLTAVLLAFFSAGCATKQLQSDFSDFSEAYANNMNWQMLLNLARLDQGHPAYFMAIGEVRLNRGQSASLSASGNRTRNTTEVTAAAVSRTVAGALGGNTHASIGATANPSFLFIPINSEEAARQLLSPISIEVFNTLYQQGWPVDQLLRVLVERIEVEFREDDTTRRVILVNSPTRGSPDSFARFLRVCEIIRSLQNEGGINLVAEEKFTPLSPALVPTVTNKELMDAADRGRVWRPVSTDAWQLGTLSTGFRFQTDVQILATVLRRYESNPHGHADRSLRNLELVLNATVGSTLEATSSREGYPARSVLILRSFRNVLEAVAQEQRAFDALLLDPNFSNQIPPTQRRPVLRTDWTESPLTPAAELLAVNYAGRRYQIADPIGLPTELATRWNRDVFRLLVNLSSQVTVDITRFQRQVLEIN